MAQVRLGMMYGNGEGVPQDDAEAAKWYRSAAEQGHGTAQLFLGHAYTNGEGVPQDDAEASKWYRSAAEQGIGGAYRALGRAYYLGRGVLQDMVQTYMWYNLASVSLTGEMQDAVVRVRDLLYREMTPDQRAEAQRLAREWDGSAPA